MTAPSTDLILVKILRPGTPGGEYKLARPAGLGSRYSRAGPGWYEPGDQRQTRPGVFGQLASGSLLQRTSELLPTNIGLLSAALMRPGPLAALPPSTTL